MLTRAGREGVRERPCACVVNVPLDRMGLQVFTSDAWNDLLEGLLTRRTQAGGDVSSVESWPNNTLSQCLNTAVGLISGAWPNHSAVFPLYSSHYIPPIKVDKFLCWQEVPASATAMDHNGQMYQIQHCDQALTTVRIMHGPRVDLLLLWMLIVFFSYIRPWITIAPT